MLVDGLAGSLAASRARWSSVSSTETNKLAAFTCPLALTLLLCNRSLMSSVSDIEILRRACIASNVLLGKKV